MPVYMIVDAKVTDDELFSQYVEKFDEVLKKFGGRFLVRGGRVTALSGNWDPERVVLIEFKTLEQLMHCFASPEYLDIAPLREQSTISRAIVVEGYR